MDEYKEYGQRLVEIMRDANFALWNAVLTLNGIFISVFAAVAVFSPVAKPLSIIIIGISMVSAFCMVLNFRSVRNQYKFIRELFGQLPATGDDPSTPQKRQEHISAAARGHIWRVRRRRRVFTSSPFKASSFLSSSTSSRNNTPAILHRHAPSNPLAPRLCSPRTCELPKKPGTGMGVSFI